MTNYDAIIIGTGQAGPFLAARLAGAGRKVAIIERKLFGGTCVNTGCTPTKAMVASAYAAHLAQRAADYGVIVSGAVRTDMKAVKARKDAISGSSRIGIETWLKGMQNCTVYQSHARFESRREIRVGTELLSSDLIYINVGGRAVVPSLPGVNQVPYLTNSSMMDVDFLPRHLVIVGGSYVGLEFGQMFRRFGSEVTILEMGPHLIGREDEDVSQAMEEIMGQEGIDVRLNSKCIGFSPHPDGVRVTADCAKGPLEAIGSHVLLAVGRRPNTDDLGLEKAGVATDHRGYIVVDEQLRTNVPGIWALGDCNRRGAFTHTAYNDYEIVAANLLDGDSRRVSDRILAYNLYTDPPLGRAGVTETEARKSVRNPLIGRRPMTKVRRAVEKGETSGFMKILVDGDSKQVLGAAILGTDGDEVIHCLLDLMYAKAPYTVMQRAVHIHPTVAELLPTILGELKPLAGMAPSAKLAA
jgi:pyruvate/2-oxoglutarate dehydrogenase complex dihydrolipoamide dehydrogenase (E3) component